LRLVREQSPEILDAIRTEKEISDGTGAKLKSMLDAYAKAFAP
jgi:F-type H+-transporting ATPase subunit alpha